VKSRQVKYTREYGWQERDQENKLRERERERKKCLVERGYSVGRNNCR